MVKKKIKTVVWSKNATNQYYKILKYLTEEAPDAIDIVGNALFDMIESLSLEYNNYPPDRFRKNNDGTYKASLVLIIVFFLSNNRNQYLHPAYQTYESGTKKSLIFNYTFTTILHENILQLA
jgi:plasmid stabilization system protein ParE